MQKLINRTTKPPATTVATAATTATLGPAITNSNRKHTDSPLSIRRIFLVEPPTTNATHIHCQAADDTTNNDSDHQRRAITNGDVNHHLSFLSRTTQNGTTHIPLRESFTFSSSLVTVMHSSPPNTTVSSNEDHHRTHHADVNATRATILFFLYLNIYWFTIFIVM